MKDFNYYFTELKKSIDEKRLEYFKKGLFKILVDQEKKEAERNSPELNKLEKSMLKTLIDVYGFEKGASYPIGTVREWKGEKYRKIAPGKWRKIYDSHSRGALQSIRIIKKKIIEAKTTDELLQLVMENVNRFQDADGNLLPIVEELKKEVNKKKTELNAGKPSAQEQIEEFKAKNQKPDKPYTNIKAENVKVGDKIHYAGGDYTVLSVKDVGNYQEIQINERRSIQVKKGTDIKLINDNYENEYGKRIKNVISKIELIKNSDKDIHDKLDELRQLKEDESKYYYQMLHDNDKDKNYSDDYYQQERVYYNIQYDNVVDNYFNPVINELWANTPEQLEKKRKEQEEKDRKKNALKNKLDSINNNYKYDYTDTEIKAAFDGVEKVQKEIEDIKNQYNQIDIDIKNNKKRMNEIYKEETEKRGLPYLTQGTLKRENEEFKQCDEKDNEFRAAQNELHQKLISKEAGLNKFMDPIADYYLKMDWEKDSTIDNCKNINEVMDLIKSKDWYSEEGNRKLDLKGVDVECGKLIFKCMERIFAIFPERKGKNISLDTNYSTGRTWASGSHWSGITFNRNYWKNIKEIEGDYNKTEGSFHPENTTVGSIVFHEYYHTITTKNDLAKTIKNKVSKSLNLEDRKSGVKKDELIAKGISEYATKNADEFGAEAFGECLNSPKPSAFAREVFKETIKHVKYLKDDNGGLV